jgi:lipopolysaccharide/colanic/teichoic acid biosynthesis glycosyltransferase
MFQYLKKNYGKTCFDIVFAFSILLFSWLLLILWMMAIVDTYTNGIFVQKELVNLEKNSIYISYERFNSIDQENTYF